MALVRATALALSLLALPLRSGALVERAPPEVALEEAPAPAAVGLAELRARPRAWLGRRVRFTLQFESVRTSWNPWLTRFGSEDWVAFCAWEDERFTWDPDTYADPARELFVRRGSPEAGLVLLVHAHERFEVVAVVREVFLDRPWIEVESLRPLREIVGAGVILHVGRARRAMAEGKWNLAVDQLERAMAGPLPEHALSELERERQECLRRRGEPAGDSPVGP